jgi:hypothetical protein
MAVAERMHKDLSKSIFDAQVDAIPALLFEKRGWRVIDRTYPIFEVAFQAPGRTIMRVRMRCNDWNELPPNVELLDADGVYLTSLPTGSTNVFNNSQHEVTKHPFICMAGSREYHTHPSHIADSWEGYKNRDSYTLPNIMGQIWEAWRKSQP